MNQHIKDIEAQLQEIDLVQLYNIRSVLEMEIDRKETIYRDEGICFECGTKMVEERECDERTGVQSHYFYILPYMWLLTFFYYGIPTTNRSHVRE